MIYNVECKIQMNAESMDECFQRLKALNHPQSWVFSIDIREYRDKEEVLCNNTMYNKEYHVELKDK